MTKQRYPHGSDEDLEIIRLNECEAADGSLRTTRFQGLWNEIERLRTANAQMLEHGREMWADVERLRAAMIRCRDDLKNGLTALCLERLENSCRSVEPTAQPRDQRVVLNETAYKIVESTGADMSRFVINRHL